MGLFGKAELTLAKAVSEMSFSNPFLDKRIELERKALGDDFVESSQPFWNWSVADVVDRPNVALLTERVCRLAQGLRAKIASGTKPSESEFELYDDVVLYVIYYTTIALDELKTPRRTTEKTWDKFSEGFDYWMNIEGQKSPSLESKAHVFSCLTQIQRAFFNIFHCMVGRSWPIAKLRARIWQSIFTHDMRRYRKCLFSNMREVTTLVTGESGTGKELVARAVGMSQYLPFNERTKSFEGESGGGFYALNLSAFSPTLIESELFGHEKGAFTGANNRRIGFLESAGPYGTVFLDEIGELDLAIQIKLLRVLQNREFQRTGDNETLTFEGKFVAATNRELATEIQNGTFRKDFYYRLCSDVIVTPTLVEQLNDQPDELEFLVEFLANRVAPGDADGVTKDVITWFKRKKFAGYQWPGNMRELEQCVRNIMIHNDYCPDRTSSDEVSDRADDLTSNIRDLKLTADELVGHYCDWAYQQTNSYEKAAAILKLDRRTVKAKIVAVNE